MAVLKPFKGIRPVPEKAKEVAARPYDVLNRAEAKEEAAFSPYHYLHVTKPEIDVDDSVDQYDDSVYQKGKENYERLVNDGILKQDEKENLYIYAQTMDGRTQYGIVGCCAVDDYLNNVIKKHEHTLSAKEEARMKHIRVSNVNYEPVFFAYPENDELESIIKGVVENNKAVYDFTSDEGFGHHFWVIDDEEKIKRIVEIFDAMESLYVADGHHRTAAAALIGKEKRENNPNHTGEEEYNFFLTVNFPANQLKIMDYNRVVKDLNGLSEEEFIARVGEAFEVEKIGEEAYRPENVHNIGMYLGDSWYKLTAKDEVYDDNDPIGCLDVSILTDNVLDKILEIGDLKKSNRIDFVGGLRGLGELEKRVNSGEMKVAFAMYPVTMEQLMNIADAGEIMPPKSTWFEPKLRSGLIVHSLED